MVVTGAASGIGAAIAQRVVDEGGRAMLLDIREPAAAGVAMRLDGRARASRCDVTCADSVRAAIDATLEHFGGLDGVVHCAAAASVDGTVLDLDLAQWRREIDVALTGAFLVSKFAVPAMIETGGGSVVLMSSVFGRIAIGGAVAYCAAKAGLVNLAKAMAIDHGAQGVRANCVSPGPVASDGVLQRWPSIEAAEAGLGPRTLLGRISRPEEIAAAAAYLLSDDAAFVTGCDLLIDGGYAAR